MEGESNAVTATYVFRGIEYIVTMNVQPATNVTVEVEDRLTADQWRATFDAAYIEDLTHKTGNFKQFNIFVSMLESAVIQASDTVSLDLLTYADLESLRQRKAGTAVKSSIPAQRSVSLNSKRYLILTYTVEFDRIHYPLPLPYMGKPDPRALQETIRQLRQEIKTLKQQGASESKAKELEKLRKDNEALLKNKEEIETEFLQFRHEIKNTSTGSAVKEIKVLKTMVRSLEEELMKEKTKHQRSAAKHGQQYRELLEELEEIRASERNLKIRVKSLTNELAMCRRDRIKGSQRTSRNPHRAERERSFDRFSSRERSLSRERPLSREGSWSSDRLSARNSSKERPSSATNKSHLSDRSSGFNKNNCQIRRSRTPSPSGARNSRFNPTAYIKEKERKKSEASLDRDRRRRANTSRTSVSSRPSPGNKLTNSRLSSNGRIRSRTSSYGSNGEFSDGGISDSSYTGLSRKKPLQTGLPPAYLSSPEVPQKSNSRKQRTRKSKILASTPESDYGKKRKAIRNKENIPDISDSGDEDDSDSFNRSAEISDIDARLNRLQQLMKTTMS